MIGGMRVMTGDTATVTAATIVMRAPTTASTIGWMPNMIARTTAWTGHMTASTAPLNGSTIALGGHDLLTQPASGEWKGRAYRTGPSLVVPPRNHRILGTAGEVVHRSVVLTGLAVRAVCDSVQDLRLIDQFVLGESRETSLYALQQPPPLQGRETG